MEADEAKATLAEFMEKHKENVDEYESLKTEFSELEETHEEAQETLSDLRTKFAEEAAEYVNLSPTVIAERFEYSEIVQLIEEGESSQEFSEDTDEPEEDDDGQLTTFSEKEEKGNRESKSPGEQYRDDAADRLTSKF